MTCTGTDPVYIHAQSVIPVDSTIPDNAPFQFSKYNCDMATPSGTIAGTVEIASGSGAAIADGIYVIWFQIAVLIVLMAVSVGTYLYKK